ncbi:MAG: hypothetical protein JWM52_200 [Candidatus Saccharibacteria bacterium]|nr:hypothetical protein [Candidatus Saccharibacteria bacterium]
MGVRVLLAGLVVRLGGEPEGPEVEPRVVGGAVDGTALVVDLVLAGVIGPRPVLLLGRVDGDRLAAGLGGLEGVGGLLGHGLLCFLLSDA